MSSIFTPTNTTSVWYQINATDIGSFVPIDETASISKFWFEVDEGDGQVKVEDQNGLGFPISDSIMLTNVTCRDSQNIDFRVAVSTCMHCAPFLERNRLPLFFCQVRKGSNPSRVFLEVDSFNSVTQAFSIVQTFDVPPPNATAPSTGAGNYEIWTLAVPALTWPNGNWNVAANIGTEKVTTAFIPSQFPGCNQ